MVAFIAVYALGLLVTSQFVEAPSWWLFGWAMSLIALFAIYERGTRNVHSN